ncbi:hypothetical protein B484DRAFT_468568 [Ochromonadaceae sp. CCMP2298]|nr:hypothetical protein B484DRAFT_468568 [Ochromonadaceae sp. CCMP2298]
MGLQNALLVLVMVGGGGPEDPMYNMMCYLQHLGLKYVVYYSDSAKGSNDVSKEDLTNNGANVISFPYELFWRLAAEKRTYTHSGKTWVKFTGPLAVINYGLYRPGALLTDPVPYFWPTPSTPNTPNTSSTFSNTPLPDFVASTESDCISEPVFMPKMGDHKESNNEVNSGAMAIRATAAGIALVQHWLTTTIEANFYDNQDGFRYPPQYSIMGSNDCNRDISYEDVLVEGAPVLRFCYLSKFMFQTGSVIHGCGGFEGFEKARVEALRRQGVIFYDYGRQQTGRFPAHLHVNPRTKEMYRMSKKSRLQQLHLWLVEEGSDMTQGHVHLKCRSLNVTLIQGLGVYEDQDKSDSLAFDKTP